MEWSIIGTNFLYAALGVVLMWVAYRLIDRMTPEVDFPAELKRGNVAVAIYWQPPGDAQVHVTTLATAMPLP